MFMGYIEGHFYLGRQEGFIEEKVVEQSFEGE